MNSQPNRGGTVMLPGGSGVGVGDMASSVRDAAVLDGAGTGALIRPRDVTQRDGRTAVPPVRACGTSPPGEGEPSTGCIGILAP